MCPSRKNRTFHNLRKKCTEQKEFVTSPWRRIGVRRPSTWLNSIVCSKTVTPADAPDWASFPHLVLFAVAKEARPVGTQPTKRQQVVRSRAFLTRVQWHSLRTDNFAYIIQVYVMPNTSSWGIMNITWLWISSHHLHSMTRRATRYSDDRVSLLARQTFLHNKYFGRPCRVNSVKMGSAEPAPALLA